MGTGLVVLSSFSLSQLSVYCQPRINSRYICFSVYTFALSVLFSVAAFPPFCLVHSSYLLAAKVSWLKLFYFGLVVCLSNLACTRFNFPAFQFTSSSLSLKHSRTHQHNYAVQSEGDKMKLWKLGTTQSHFKLQET